MESVLQSTPGSSPRHDRIPELDGIRGIAILLVIGCHYTGFAALAWGLPSFGWIGVDIFFVLSGFLITSILVGLRNTRSSLKVFYTRRILRIFPVYYIMIAIVTLLSLANHERMVHPGFVISRVLFLQAVKDCPGFLSQGFHRLLAGASLFPPSRPLPPVVPGVEMGPWANSLSSAWSLSIEENFYLLWAPVVLFARNIRAVWITAVAAMLSACLVQWIAFTGLPDYFLFVCRVPSIMAGSLLALFMLWRAKTLHETRRLLDRTALFTGLTIAALIGALIVINWPILGREIRESASFVLIGMPLLAIELSIVLGWTVARTGQRLSLLRFFRWRPLRRVGTISYSLYLIHVPVYLAFLHLASAMRLPNWAMIWLSLASLLVSLTIAELSWRYFESRVLRWKDRWAPLGGNSSRTQPEVAFQKMRAKPTQIPG